MFRQKPDEVIKAHPPSILQTDVSFTGFEGFAVTQSLKNQPQVLSTIGQGTHWLMTWTWRKTSKDLFGVTVVGLVKR